MSPAGKPLAIGGWAKTATGEGVLAAFGGKESGFSLYLAEGRPTFAVRSRRRLLTVAYDQPVPTGEWFHLMGVIGHDAKLRLCLNGDEVAEAEGRVVQSLPRNGFAVGDDPASPVGEYPNASAWSGLIEDVRLYWGEPDAGTLEAWTD